MKKTESSDWERSKDAAITMACLVQINHQKGRFWKSLQCQTWKNLPANYST